MGNSDSVYFDRVTNEFVGLDGVHLQKLKEAYTHVDVDEELKKMSLWLQSAKGKRRKGNIGFILHWLNNATPKYTPSLSDHLDLLESEAPLRLLIQDYLRELWKGKEHILELNKIRKP